MRRKRVVVDDQGITFYESPARSCWMRWSEIESVSWEWRYRGSEQGFCSLWFRSPALSYSPSRWLDDCDVNQLIAIVKDRVPDRARCTVLRLPRGYKDAVQRCMILGARYRNRGKFKHSESAYRNALEIMRSAVGPDHSDAVPILEKYSQLLHQTGRACEAQTMEARAKAMAQKRKDPYPPH